MAKKKYFNIEHGHILFTNNNWKDFGYRENKNEIDSTYEVEDNSSVIQRVMLRNLYGVQTASLILEEFNKIDNEYNTLKKHHLNEDAGYGDHFEIFAISMLYDISYEKVIEDHLIIGNLDGGIDAIYYNESEVYIIQIKMNQLVKDNTIECMTEAIDEYERTHTLKDEKKKHLLKFLDKHYDNDIYGKNINYLTISKNSKRPENITPEKIYNDYIGKTGSVE